MKKFFMMRNLREKLLVLLMLVVGVVIWASLFAERASALMAERNRLNRINEDLSFYIDNREAIRDRAQAGIAKLDPRRTLNSTRLSVEVGSLARKHNLNPSIGSPRSEAGDVFSNHTVVLSVRDADLASLINFTGELQSRAPYVGLEQVVVTVRPTDRRLLNAQYTISSVELNPSQ